MAVEPDDDPAAVKPVALPATLVGTVEKPGDRDHFRFEAKAGQRLVFSATARALGSNLRGRCFAPRRRGPDARGSDRG